MNENPLAVLRRNLRRSGLQQIDAAIAQLEAQLQNPELSAADQVFLAGRRRELRAARWLVNRLLVAQESAPAAPSSATPPPPVASPTIASGRATPPEQTSDLPNFSELLTQSAAASSMRTIQAVLLDSMATRLSASLLNLTDTPLEIDILREDKKRELLYIILKQLEEILDELRFSQVTPEQLREKYPLVMQDLWQAAATDFLGRYYSLAVGDQSVLLVDRLLQDAEIVQTAILNKIPGTLEFLAHLLFQTPLTIDGIPYAIGTVEAMARLEMLLQNLTIQIANAVMQPLLNHFGDVITIKQNFYDKRLLSSREIERFRNNLSWRYRIENLVGEPTAIFESRFYLFVFSTLGITKTSIYAARNQELSDLAGIQLAVTLTLEMRDAIAPRLRTAIAFVGSGVVYVLTEVIGRGIGLIGRGVIKGIGNVLRDNERGSERFR
ncbi:DUF3685 domain-containing protein [Pantanalinema sp. GBBB05]|uniref:DUF3685 domain-containing protein n=1 Tax=Pantanalinema sp. GBBB05 TaxID=2604139 RepID=UPI001DBA3556|nr:DUF3685 domain-containing protein [Pantanalinema sp. GBBB05]